MNTRKPNFLNCNSICIEVNYLVWNLNLIQLISLI